MRPLMPAAVILLVLGLLTLITGGLSLQHCSEGQACAFGQTTHTTLNHASLHHASTSAAAAAPAVRKWYGFGPSYAWYPVGDCATQCSRELDTRMHSCEADPDRGIPQTTCNSVAEPDVCPTSRYLDAVLPENYCMPRFDSDCSHPDNIGCSSRCILYVIINYHCTADAYNPETKAFNASCVTCNMCWDRSGAGKRAAKKVPYALLQARGASGSLYANHWLVLPKAPCIGIESAAPGCTDARGEYIWSNAYTEATSLGFHYAHGQPTWAMMLNSPNRRGIHQMHIHIAHFDEQRSNPGIPQSQWLVRKLAAAEVISTNPAAPTRIQGEGYFDPVKFASCRGLFPLGRPPRDWARVYAVFVHTADPARDLGHSIKPFELARQLSAASGQPGHGYGIILMPRKFGRAMGLLVGIVWSSDDVEQLDVSELEGDPIGFSHTCHNYIGFRPTWVKGS